MPNPTKEKTDLVRREQPFKVRSINKERRVVTFIASTDAVDSYGERILQTGWDMTRFLAHPVVPFGHDYWSLPVGKSIRTEVVNGALETDIEIAPAEANPLAENVFQCLLAGVPLGVSVGFYPLEWHYETLQDGSSMRIYDKCELIEISVVTVPSNPEALQKAITEGIRSTKVEKRTAAAASLELLTRLFAQKTAEPTEPEDETEDEPEETEEAPTVQAEEARAILKAYRKLVPSLRSLLNVETLDDEAKQIAAIRSALARRDAETVTPAEGGEPAPVAPAETTPAPAETPAADAPAAEPALDAEDLQAIAEETATILAEKEIK
jgi:HK97 family phage prohead protease